MHTSYGESIEQLKHSVANMIRERSQRSDQTSEPSPVWCDALSVFEYLMNLSARDFENIRFHTSLITGESTITFWHQYPPVDAAQFAERSGYDFYTAGIPDDFCIGEAPSPRMPRPLGVDYKGRVINMDTVRYQECISNLYTMGILPEMLGAAGRNVILEIGGGYGALANHLSRIFSGRVTYVIVDLPEMFLFSGAYLSLLNPTKKIYFYDKSTFTDDFLRRGLLDYDIVLLPNYIASELVRVGPDINLMLNMQSFQEMASAQISEYAALGATKLSGCLYSHNIDRHPFNERLKPRTVTAQLVQHFLLFPPPEFYTSNVPGIDQPWCYRTYFGISRLRPRPLPTGGFLRYIGDIGGGRRFEIKT